MIELAMVRRMVRRAALLAPVVIAALFLFDGVRGAASAAIGVSLLALNLWIAGRVLGGLAENRPELLVAGAMVSLFVGLAIVVLAGVFLQRLDDVSFPVAGLVFALGHLVVATWEAADQFLRIPKAAETTTAVDRDHGELMHGA